MTISTSFTKTRTAGNGVTTAFPYPYPVLAASHLVVKLVNNTTGIETLQVLNTHYTVSTTPASSVTITFLVAPANTVSVTIDEVVPETQVDVDFTKFGPFDSEAVEKALDKLTLLTQQAANAADKSIQIDPTLVDFTGSTKITQNAADRASKAIGFSADGLSLDLFVNPGAAAADAQASAEAAALSAVDAAGAETAAELAATAAEVAATTAADAATDATNAAAMFTKDFISGIIPIVTNMDYRVALNLPYGLTINKITTRCTGGTCTLTGKINNTALANGANSVSTTEQTQLHATGNVAVVGDDLVLTVSSNSSCLNLSFLIEFTRTV